MDRNLKYVILECLAEQDIYQYKELEDIYSDEFGEKWDTIADYNYDPNPRIEEYYAGLNLEECKAGELESLVFDDTMEIHHCVWNQWDGECDYFDIMSLQGIEVCKNLTELDLSVMMQIDDLSPLAALGKLKSINIENNNYSPIKTVEGLEALLELPELESVTIENIKVASPEKLADIIKELEERGVEVNIELHD